MVKRVIFIIFLTLVLGLFSIENRLYSALKNEIDQVETLNRQGVYFRMQGNQQEAIKCFTKAIGIDPNYAESYCHRGMSYGGSAVQKYDLAMADFNKAIELIPSNGEYYLCRGLLYYQMQDFEKSWLDIAKAESLGFDLSKYTEVLSDVRSSCAQYYSDRAKASLAKKDYDKCWLDLNKAIELGYKTDPQFLSDLKKVSGRNK